MRKRKLRKLIKEVITEVSHVKLDGLPPRSGENTEGRLAEYESTFLPTAHDIRRIVAEELVKAGVSSYHSE